MTGEEMQRAIEFLLEHHATLEARVEQTSAQLGELGRRLEAYAETQSEFIEIATHSIQALTDAQLRTEQVVAQLTGAQLRTEQVVVQIITRQVETDARLDRLTQIVERFVNGGRNGQE
jgi:hypothetical protein